MKHIYSAALIAVCLCFLPGCRKDNFGENIPPSEETSLADATAEQARCSRLSAHVATDWMQVYRRIVKSESKNPPQASRIYAYAAIGLYEAVQPGNFYRSLEGQVPGLANMPKWWKFGRLDYTLAANESMYQVAKTIFVTLKPENQTLIDSLHNDYLADATAASTSSTIIASSTSFGQQVAVAVLNRAANDNFAATRTLTYVVPSQSVNPAFWAPTSAVVNPLEPYWGTLQPFAMANGAACTIKSSIAFSTAPGSLFYNQALEVANTVINITQPQKDIALWWADGTGATPTPPGHWVGIGNVVVKKLNLSLAEASRMFAALNMSMADAFISCFDEKYKLNLLRPVSYIKTYIPGQTTWAPVIGTPPFPEYPSGHSVSSGAAADILTRLYGNVSFTDSSNVNLGYAPRTYNSFNEAANEAGISRLYGGIHFREAIEKGLLQGKAVSRTLAQRIKF